MTLKKYALHFLIGLCLIPSLCSQEIGLQLYSLRNQFSEGIEPTLELINRWGIKYVEGGNSYGLRFEEFNRLLDRYDIDLVSIGVDYDDLRDNVELVIANAQKSNVSLVTCFWIPHQGYFDLEHAEEAIKVFNRTGEKLQKYGITLSYHPHGYEFTTYNEGTLMDYIAQNAKHFGFQIDTFWFVHGGSDPATFFETYSDLVVSVHLKDMQKGVSGDGSGHQSSEHSVVLGQGQIDIKSIIDLAEIHGLKYLFIEDESSDAVRQIPKSLNYLKQL